ncbi:MAG: 4-hydroxybenzoyl-CoA reductase subunit beta [Hyphomicrobiales bacterium]|nr:4-hydroxybenzoyl-CoA reductase subunit beta [Hyphomicrobiales bacterium]MCP5374324.1 4-hydroxybenzoyl-CoA reductase subunit beta [Hyphomicrobiales bacterium]
MEPIAPFQFRKPATVAELSAILADEPGARLLGGGTDLLPNLRRGIEKPPTVVDITAVDEMQAIRRLDDGSLRIGAAVTLAEVAEHPDLRAAWPVVAKGAGEVAGPTHRLMGTVGGNLCLDTRCVYYNQSEWWRTANDYCLKKDGEMCHVAPKSKKCFAAYSGDLAPAALVAGATVDVAGPHAPRTVPLADIFQEDGIDYLVLAPGEFVVALNLPAPPPGLVADYAKVRVRGSIDFPLAGVAVALARDGDTLADLRIALTGTNSQPLAVTGLDAFAGKAPDEDTLAAVERLVAKQMQPMRSTFTPQTYRRQVALRLTRRLIGDLFGD